MDHTLRSFEEGIKRSWMRSKLRENDLDEIQIKGECMEIEPSRD